MSLMRKGHCGSITLSGEFLTIYSSSSTCFSHLPEQFKDFYLYLSKLTYKDKLDYELLKRIVLKSMPSNVTDQTPYDWESIYPVYGSEESSD